jgi:phosphate transport system permease protein
LGRSVLSGALTLSLLILPVVIVAAQEALRSIPSSLRHGAYALGATQWQTIRHQVLPPAIPGILTGVILALSRAIGETAPLVMIGALTYIAFTPGSIEHASDLVRNPQAVVDAPFSLFTAMPILIFNWVSQPKSEFQHVAAAAIVVLLAILLILNATAVLVRHRFQNRIRW